MQAEGFLEMGGRFGTLLLPGQDQAHAVMCSPHQPVQVECFPEVLQSFSVAVGIVMGFAEEDVQICILGSIADCGLHLLRCCVTVALAREYGT